MFLRLFTLFGRLLYLKLKFSNTVLAIHHYLFIVCSTFQLLDKLNFILTQMYSDKKSLSIFIERLPVYLKG